MRSFRIVRKREIGIDDRRWQAAEPFGAHVVYNSPLFNQYFSFEVDMAKHVMTKSGILFNTLKAAQDYFSKLREGTPLGARLSEP